MVRVAMGNDQPRDALAGERTGQELRPSAPAGAVVDACVEDRNSAVIVD